LKKTFRRFILTFIILTIFSCDKNKMFKNENIGNDYSIVDGISKIDELVRAEMNINNIPGLVILIKKNNKIILIDLNTSITLINILKIIINKYAS